MKRFKPQRLALLISMAFAAPALMAQQSTDVGRINVDGQQPQAVSSHQMGEVGAVDPAAQADQGVVGLALAFLFQLLNQRLHPALALLARPPFGWHADQGVTTAVALAISADHHAMLRRGHDAEIADGRVAADHWAPAMAWRVR
jgi:hypothetical protein